jgi:hypothetical protein
MHKKRYNFQYALIEYFQMGYVVAGVSLVAPLVCCIMIQRISRKKILLFSASLMSAAMIFLALLIHFQTDVQQVKARLCYFKKICGNKNKKLRNVIFIAPKK